MVCNATRRSSLKTLFKEPEFKDVADKTRTDLLLEKAVRYEHLLDELHAVVTGERPQQMRYHEGGPLFPLNCTDNTFTNKHNAGTEYKCGNCAVHMTKLFVEKLADTEH